VHVQSLSADVRGCQKHHEQPRHHCVTRQHAEAVIGSNRCRKLFGLSVDGSSMRRN
jgi:hypothetical protein